MMNLKSYLRRYMARGEAYAIVGAMLAGLGAWVIADREVWDNTHWLELIWLVVVASGWALYVWALLSARADWKRNCTNPVPMARYMTKIVYQASYLFVFVESIMLANAMYGIFHPPPPPDYSELPQSIANLLSWIVVSFGLSYHALVGRIWRVQISSGRIPE